MTRRTDELPDLPDDALPPGLLADLGRLSPTPRVPGRVDADVRNRARAYLANQRRVRRWVRLGGAAAAVVAVGVGTWMAVRPAGLAPSAAPNVAYEAAPAAATAPSRLVAGPADIDRNGVVNVLDAFAVARGVRDGRADPAWDVNRDGVVDARDAEQIARTAVTVRPSGGVQ